MCGHTDNMDYLSDEQIKILFISKESATICDAVVDLDYEGKLLDGLIKNSSDFRYFSLGLTLLTESIVGNKIQNIIKSQLGLDGLKVLNHYENLVIKRIQEDLDVDEFIQEKRDAENYESIDIFESNTPEEDRDGWDYY